MTCYFCSHNAEKTIPYVSMLIYGPDQTSLLSRLDTKKYEQPVCESCLDIITRDIGTVTRIIDKQTYSVLREIKEKVIQSSDKENHV